MDFDKLAELVSEKRIMVKTQTKAFYPKGIYDLGGIDKKCIESLKMEYMKLKMDNPKITKSQFFKALEMEFDSLPF